jgi:hypothetical protein
LSTQRVRNVFRTLFNQPDKFFSANSSIDTQKQTQINTHKIQKQQRTGMLRKKKKEKKRNAFN